MTDATPSSGATLVALFEQVGKVMAVVASMLLVVSVFYDYCFLFAVGLSFDDIPSSLSEHVRSAILWAPKLVLTAFGLFVYELFLRRAEGGKSEEELIAGSPYPRFTRVFRKSADLAIPVVIGFTSLIGVFLSHDLASVYLLFVLVWGFLALSVVKHPRLGASLSGLRARLFIVLPMLLSMVGFYGYQSGVRMLERAAPKWEVVIRDGAATTKQSILGIRRFGSFAIIVDQSRLVSVIPNGAIVSVKILASPVRREANACRWFGVLCKSAQNPSSNQTVQIH